MIVSLETAKEWLKIQHNEEDELIKSLILSVQGMVEDRCRVTFDEDAPMPVQLAVKLLVCFFYEQRDVTEGPALASVMRCFYALLEPHRDPDKMF